MSRQKPGIVQGDDCGHGPTEPRQFPEVEVIAVEVVQMQHIRIERRLLQQVPCAREIEIFMPGPPGPESPGRCQAWKPSLGHPLRPTDATGEMIQPSRRGHPEPSPRRPVGVMLDQSHPGEFACATADKHCRLMPTGEKGIMKSQANAGSPAAPS